MVGEHELETPAETFPPLDFSKTHLRLSETSQPHIWSVLVAQSLPEYSPPLNSLNEILRIAQALPKARGREERKIDPHHWAAAKVLVENWSKIAPHLYPLKPDSLLSESSLVCIPEVSLREFCHKLSLDPEKFKIHGRPDIIGLGPDGTIFVVEVGTKNKRPQIETYLTELNKILPRSRIIGLIAYSHPKGREISLWTVPSF